MKEIEKALALLQQAASATIVTHERPDGDAIGSLLALSLSLEIKGLSITPVIHGGLPEMFMFLPGADRIQGEIPSRSDLFIVVDCSDLARTGFTEKAFSRKPDLNIDHHPTNNGFADLNIVRPEAVATAELLFDLFPEFDLPFSSDIATNLLGGLLSDTIGFRTSNVSPKSLRVAADLMELGASLSDLHHRILTRRSFESARYWGSGLSSLERSGGLLWARLTLEDRLRSGYPGPDDADLINILSTIDEARIVVLFVEQPGKRVKVSWRALDGQDVSKIAEQFGGGGHAPAAGAMIDGSMEEAQASVLEVTRLELAPALER